MTIEFVEGSYDLIALLENALRVVGPRIVNTSEQFRKGRRSQASAAIRREVGASVEGLAIGSQPNVERPASASGQLLNEGHVDAVDVGPFLAIDFDADVVFVEISGDFRIGKGLAVHDVTPVAGRVADREQDDLVFGFRFSEGFIAPRVPIDGIVGVLLQVRRLLVDQSIRFGVWTRGFHCPSGADEGECERSDGECDWGVAKHA